MRRASCVVCMRVIFFPESNVDGHIILHTPLNKDGLGMHHVLVLVYRTA